jgi:MFS family permease
MSTNTSNAEYYYRHNFLSDSSPSAISWIGTVQSWLLILGGVLSGPLFDRGWYRVMLLVGNAGVIFGIFMLSLSHTYWQVFLSQGICMGLGAGLLYVPSLALVGLSFSKKRSLAQGIVTSGIAVGASNLETGKNIVYYTDHVLGGVAYILEFNHLTATKDFGFAVRTMGLTATGLCLIALPALLKGTSGSVMPSMTENCVANAISALAKPRPARKLYDSAAFKDIAFVLFTLCSFATFLGYLVFYFFVVSYCKEVLGFSQTWSMNVLMISIASSFFGRLSAGVVAHYLG